MLIFFNFFSGGDKEGLNSSPFHHQLSGDGGESVSSTEVYVETRKNSSFRSTLSVASSTTTSGVSSGAPGGHTHSHSSKFSRSPLHGNHNESSRNTSATPTWTEGTPSFTESSSSGDLGMFS